MECDSGYRFSPSPSCIFDLPSGVCLSTKNTFSVVKFVRLFSSALADSPDGVFRSEVKDTLSCAFSQYFHRRHLSPLVFLPTGTAGHAAHFIFFGNGYLAVPRSGGKKPSRGLVSCADAVGAAGPGRPVHTGGASHAPADPGAPPPGGRSPALRACPSLPAEAT